MKGVWYPSPTLYVLKLSGSCLGSSSRKWQLWLSGCTSGHRIFFFFLPCEACGILVPQPGIEPTLPALEARSPNHWTAREVPASAWDFDASVCCFHLGDVDKWRNTERALNMMPLQPNCPTLLLDSWLSAEFSQQAKPSSDRLGP